MSELLTVDEALVRASSNGRDCSPTEMVAVADAVGRVLREPALARVDLPPFASSAMDGFALRAAETPGELPVAFRSRPASLRPVRFLHGLLRASRLARRCPRERTLSFRSSAWSIAAIASRFRKQRALASTCDLAAATFGRGTRTVALGTG